MVYKPVFLTLVSLFAVAAQKDDELTCSIGTIKTAGTEGARRVIEAWASAYTAKCPDFHVETEGGGYPMGAARVCDNHISYTAVDIGGMSGPFFHPQATTEDGWSYDCKHSGRKAHLVRTKRKRAGCWF